MDQHHFQEFIQEYSEKFDLLKDIVFNATVTRVERNSKDNKWIVNVGKGDTTEAIEFDKVVFCHGYQTRRRLPVYPGQDEYTGLLMHSQQYRQYESVQTRSELG